MENMYSQRSSSRLFTSGTTLLLMPLMAEKIGLNEAIILQQINYWVTNPLNKNIKDGRVWVYNTYEQWVQQFPFFSYSTIKRTILSLQNKKLLISGSFNEKKGDKTKWYTIDFEITDSLDVGTSAQIEPTISSNWPDHQLNLSRCTITKTTSKITKENNKRKFDSEFEEFWKLYKKKVDRHKCEKLYKTLLASGGISLHQEIMKSLTGQLREREVNEELGEWNPPQKNPSTWLNGRCWGNQFKTEGEIHEAHKRNARKIANKPSKTSRVDQLHSNNARVRDAIALRIEALDREEEELDREEARIKSSILSIGNN